MRPSVVGTFETHSNAVDDLWVDGSTAYLFDEGEGLIALDVSNPAAPARLGNYHSPALLRKIVRRDNLLYVTDTWNGFTILDITDPSRPQVAGVYQAPHLSADQLGFPNWGLDVDGANSWRMFSFDVSDPSSITALDPDGAIIAADDVPVAFDYGAARSRRYPTRRWNKYGAGYFVDIAAPTNLAVITAGNFSICAAYDANRDVLAVTNGEGQVSGGRFSLVSPSNALLGFVPMERPSVVDACPWGTVAVAGNAEALTGDILHRVLLLDTTDSASISLIASAIVPVQVPGGTEFWPNGDVLAHGRWIYLTRSQNGAAPPHERSAGLAIYEIHPRLQGAEAALAP